MSDLFKPIYDAYGSEIESYDPKIDALKEEYANQLILANKAPKATTSDAFASGIIALIPALLGAAIAKDSRRGLGEGLVGGGEGASTYLANIEKHGKESAATATEKAKQIKGDLKENLDAQNSLKRDMLNNEARAANVKYTSDNRIGGKPKERTLADFLNVDVGTPKVEAPGVENDQDVVMFLNQAKADAVSKGMSDEEATAHAIELGKAQGLIEQDTPTTYEASGAPEEVSNAPAAAVPAPTGTPEPTQLVSPQEELHQLTGWSREAISTLPPADVLSALNQVKESRNKDLTAEKAENDLESHEQEQAAIRRPVVVGNTQYSLEGIEAPQRKDARAMAIQYSRVLNALNGIAAYTKKNVVTRLFDGRERAAYKVYAQEAKDALTSLVGLGSSVEGSGKTQIRAEIEASLGEYSGILNLIGELGSIASNAYSGRATDAQSVEILTKLLEKEIRGTLANAGLKPIGTLTDQGVDPTIPVNEKRDFLIKEREKLLTKRGIGG